MKILDFYAFRANTKKESLLGKLNKQALIDLLMNLTNKDLFIKQELLLHLDHIAALSLAIDTLETLFTSGDVAEKNAEDSFRWVLAIAEEAVSSTFMARDKMKLFNLIFRHATSALYSQWTDWRICLLFATAPLCSDLAIRNKLEAYIRKRQKILWSSKHYIDERYQLQELQHLLFESFDCKSTAFLYMTQNLDNSRFRRTIIESAIENKQYGEALKLCFEGEAKDRGHVGLMRQWRFLRYAIYEASGDACAQRILALELFREGNLQYYEKSRELIEQTSR